MMSDRVTGGCVLLANTAIVSSGENLRIKASEELYFTLESAIPLCKPHQAHEGCGRLLLIEQIPFVISCLSLPISRYITDPEVIPRHDTG
jgi:hypothetical protein